ncbi:hypothetical protein CWE13_07685 [Aliidiomarina shirensis]|uniref:Protein SlyX homolog n=1 Tax=Aliidiomarina shirensis TaxID=1048642 RepID=A0A432WSH7_9GAMM|nr:SlyX family protein [Aliidiomarina shirensis]RUO36723.1 hypothetical protein CWE13_07685 [Aliidiomarina shirensis]
MTDFPAEAPQNNNYSVLEQRIVDLESQLAFQEDTISELNKLVTAQSQELHRIQKHLVLVAERLQQIPESQDQAAGDERPPHY